MSLPTLESWSLERLGLKTATFRRLHSKGLRNLENLLECEPGELSIRSQIWSEIGDALQRVAGSLDQAQVDRIEAFLKAGDEVAAERAGRPKPEAPPELPAALGDVYQAVRRAAHPVSRRSLMREHGLTRPLMAQLVAPPFVLYPYGLQGWVGLREWGAEGYRKAARTSWNVLPVHLRKLRAKGENLSEQAWQAVSDVAVERRDLEMLFTATEALAPPPSPEPTIRPPASMVRETWTPPQVRETLTAPTPALVHPEIEPLPAPVPALKDPQPDTVEPPVEPAATEHSYYAQLPSEIKALLAKSRPQIFADLEYDDTLGGAAAVAAAARSQTLPFSLVELGGTTGDYQWLKKWAATLDWHSATGWLNDLHPFQKIEQTYWAGNECLGILLLFLCAETGRREAREGEIWSHIPNHFTSSARGELFMGGQPRAVTRRAIESAAKRLGVRHAFDTEGSQAWYQTIYLQFGFTKTGVQSLPIWLGCFEHVPSAVARLFEESAIFRNLWDTLRAYRNKKRVQKDVSAEIFANPFTLDSWNTEILQTAQIRLEGQSDVYDGGELPILRSRLVWPPLEQPAFELSWQALPSLGLTESGYDVFCDGDQIGRLALQNADYQPYPESFAVSLRSPYLTLEVEGDEGQDEREVDHILWNTDDEFHLFDAKTGLPLSRDKTLSTQRSIYLLAGPGLRLEPAPEVAQELAEGRTLFALTAPWNPDTAVVDASGVVATLSTKSPPPWIADCVLGCPDQRPFRFGESATFYLCGLPPEAQIVSARAWSKTVAFVERGKTWDARIAIDPSIKTSRVGVHFTVSCPSGRYSFQRSAAIKLHDVAVRLPGHEEWQAFDNLPRLTAQDLKRAKVRFFLQPDHTHYGIMGATTFLQRPPQRLAAIELAGGYGESLSLWEGPYNRLAESKTHQLCQEYLDCGLVQSIQWRNDGTFQVQLTRAIEPSADHFLLFWNVDGELEFVTNEELDSWDDGLWTGQLKGFSGPVSVSLGFEDRRLGAARSPGFEPPWNDPRPLRTAGLLRWMKLPLLRDSWRGQVRAFAQAHMNECLSSWVFDSEVRDAPAKLAYEETEEWLGVIRSLLDEVAWETESFQSTWTHLLELRRKGVEPPEHFLQLLMAVPLTALELGREVLGPNEFRMLVTGLVLAPFGTDVFQKKMVLLAKEAARAMGGVDSRFLDSLLSQASTRKKRARENLQLALQRPAFVRYLAAITLAGWLTDGKKGTKNGKA